MANKKKLPSMVKKAKADASESLSSKAGAFPIIGIGASAGGLEAFEAFFSGMPADEELNMAFVLVQHLAPDHKSMLTDLLKRYTRMPVVEVKDGIIVQPNCVYIIPPNREMSFFNGSLQLFKPIVPRGHRFPIDILFRSLAEDQHQRAICIILSGTGSDGTLGLRSIKNEGGIAIAQSIESSEFDGMPKSAIDTGLVDFILTPKEMPAQLLACTNHTLSQLIPSSSPSQSDIENSLRKIFVLLRSRTGHDFSGYKPSTISRRIERRMAVNQISKPEDYVNYLQKSPEEIDALFHDFLIGVTSFFRDPGAFDALEQEVIPRIFEGKPEGSEIRAWICGCSSGEEAYSIAILLQEQLEKLELSYRVHVFASDIDTNAIEAARKGFFPVSIAGDISPDRLARYFILDSDGKSYRIQKRIREMIIFSEQDVIKDPPFSRIDLLSCRNLLIYMGQNLQAKAISLFHFALASGGYLFLGTSETVSQFTSLYSTVSRKYKIYQRKETDRINKPKNTLPFFSQPLANKPQPDKTYSGTPKPRAESLQVIAEKTLLHEVVHAGILINQNGDILYLHGRTGMYLEPATGEASAYNVLKMAREGLKSELVLAVRLTASRGETIRRTGIRVKTNGDYTTVNLSVIPVEGTTAENPATPLYMVVLALAEYPLGQLSNTAEPTGNADETLEARIVLLQDELQQSIQDRDDFIQSASEEQQSSNEELKSANEELQSINEELQSTNEELESSKEELQSLNEELSTINTELETKVLDLSQVNNDIDNLLTGTGIGTIFLDMQLRILRFTPSATQIIRLIKSDVGRPIVNFVSTLKGYDQLENDIQGTLDNLIPKEVEVQTLAGAYYLMRILPYRTTDNRIEGAVVNFINIDKIKQAEKALAEATEVQRLAAVMRDAYDAIILQDLKGTILAWNPSAERIYGWSEAEALTKNISALIPEDLRTEDITRLQRASKQKALEPYRTKRIAKDKSVLDILVSSTILMNDSGEIYAVATTERLANQKLD